MGEANQYLVGLFFLLVPSFIYSNYFTWNNCANEDNVTPKSMIGFLGKTHQLYMQFPNCKQAGMQEQWYWACDQLAWVLRVSFKLKPDLEASKLNRCRNSWLRWWAKR